MSLIKRKEISENLEDYSIAIGGLSGIGKTTVMKEMCEKEFGEDGYAILNMGKEKGVDCIEGAAYIDIPDWKTFDTVTKEIIKNKDTEYPNLKVLVCDTLDQCIEIATPYVISLWNKENLGKKEFVPARTLNGSWTGFGHGEEKVIEVILDKVWQLKKAGVQMYYTFHTKSRDIVDPLTNETYTILSTDMQQKYFNGFKTKMHIVGIAAIDRTIEVEKTGRKNVVTKKDITVNKIKGERRKIMFRDDNFSVDSKSRFAGIVDEIDLNADELIKALKDAIQIEKNKSSKSTAPKTTKPAPKPKPVEEEIKVESDPLPEEFEDDSKLFEEEIVEETSDYPSDDELVDVVVEMFKKCTNKELKAEIRGIAKEYGKFSEIPTDELKKMFDKLKPLSELAKRTVI